MKETQIGRQYTQMSKVNIIYIYIYNHKNYLQQQAGQSLGIQSACIASSSSSSNDIISKTGIKPINPLITKQFLIRFLVESENIKHKQNTGDTLGKYQGNVTNEHVRILRPFVSFVPSINERHKNIESR